MTWNPFTWFALRKARRRAFMMEYVGRAEQWRREEAERERQACDICSGRSVYLCAHCQEPIQYHTHENDFSCARHGFINPIRLSDGARINGDGRIHPTWEVCQ